MYNKKIARRYTLALYEIAKERKLTNAIKKDFISIKATINSSKDFKLFLKSPIINSGKKRAIFREIFLRKLNDLTLNFFDILTEKNRENILFDIAQDFLHLLNEKEGILEVSVRIAIELTQDEKKNLANKLRDFSGKQIDANYHVDPIIKGGFVARIDDTIIDASIKRQLELLYDRFQKGDFINN